MEETKEMNDFKKNFKKVPGPKLHMQKSTRSQIEKQTELRL